jgi:hypothetical protein
MGLPIALIMLGLFFLVGAIAWHPALAIPAIVFFVMSSTIPRGREN